MKAVQDSNMSPQLVVQPQVLAVVDEDSVEDSKMFTIILMHT